MTGILAPRRQHLSCYVRSAERLANWEAARRCIVVAGIVAGCHFAALQRKTWLLREFADAHNIGVRAGIELRVVDDGSSKASAVQFKIMR